MCVGEKMESGSNAKTKHISEIICGYFESEGHIIQPLPVSVSQVVDQRNVSLLSCGELNNEDYNVLSPVEEKLRLGVFDEVCFCMQTALKHYVYINSTT
jgi:hypothetical protein